MDKVYVFYLLLDNKESRVCKYDASEWSKEEMHHDVIYNEYSDARYVIREKRIDWEMRYRCPFLLTVRRKADEDNKEFVSSYKQQFI